VIDLSIRFIRSGDVIPPELSGRVKDLRPSDNVVVAVDSSGVVYGLLISRPVQFVESLYIAEGAMHSSRLKERTLRDMVQFGLGWATANGCPEVVFLNENTNLTIRKFLKQFGAQEQVGENVVSYLPLQISVER
jgi:hypothetical protein